MLTELLYASCAIVALYLFTRPRRRLPYPPGPKADPVIGHVRFLPTSYSWLYYARVGKELGSDIIRFSALGQSIIVLNSYKALNDLIQQRSAIYSDRPRVVLVGEMMGWANSVVLSRFSPGWRVHRKLFVRHMSKTAVQDYYGGIEHELRAYAARLLAGDAKNFIPELQFTITRLIVGTTYGLEVHSTKDEFVKLAEEVAERNTRCTAPGAFLVDTIPALRHIPAWVPGARNFQTEAADGHRAAMRVISLPFDQVKEEMAANTAKPSFTSRLLEEMKDGRLQIDEMGARWLSGTMYGAGSDTTVSSISSFLLAMTHYADAQRKAQEEIDRVVGHDRLPGFGDKENLPYVECLIKEVYRWHVIAPIAVPRRLMQDDEYRGYYLPKGAIVITNNWAISRDEEMYPDPETFLPERFLPASDGSPSTAMDPRNYIFGHGKRLCAGKQFAEAAFYMSVVTILATLNISKPLDKDENEYTQPLKFSGSLISPPEPFECTIKPRRSGTLHFLQEAIGVAT